MSDRLHDAITRMAVAMGAKLAYRVRVRGADGQNWFVAEGGGWARWSEPPERFRNMTEDEAKRVRDVHINAGIASAKIVTVAV